jgi:hypothetical protein
MEVPMHGWQHNSAIHMAGQSWAGHSGLWTLTVCNCSPFALPAGWVLAIQQDDPVTGSKLTVTKTGSTRACTTLSHVLRPGGILWRPRLVESTYRPAALYPSLASFEVGPLVRDVYGACQLVRSTRKGSCLIDQYAMSVSRWGINGSTQAVS